MTTITELRRLYVDCGYTLREIEARVGMTQWTVARRLRAAEVQMRARHARPGSIRMADTELERVRVIYDGLGLSVAEIADHLRLSYGGAYRRCVNAGVSFRPQGRTKRRAAV